MQTPNDGQRQGKDSNVTNDVDYSGCQVEFHLHDAVFRPTFPEAFDWGALEDEGEEIGEENPKRKRSNRQRRHAKGSGMENSPVKYQNSDLDTEDADGPENHVEVEVLTRSSCQQSLFSIVSQGY